ncbi:anti-sigma-F factor Fin [Paenisporosarcina sp. TG20]|uniref:anti-sigma-F factor Fin n=1 Tax=Paenisporosarcina sp. TG20 TaxID=1211706 RepID=UPI00031C4584|nr:anti-sigma-F factor Fin [Paenisporosarcina sp. TG20]
MSIRVKCRHCKKEMGHLTGQSVLQHGRVKQMKEEFSEEFITENEEGILTVNSICEHCEKSLLDNPDYYAMQKWIQ